MTTSDTTVRPNWFRRLITPPQFEGAVKKTRTTRLVAEITPQTAQPATAGNGTHQGVKA